MRSNIFFKLSAFLALIIVATTASAQAQRFTLSGTVYDENGRDGVPYATVRAVNKGDSTAVFRSAASEAGVFSISGMPAGEYDIKITSVGYEDGKASIRLSGDTDMGAIRLKEDKNILDGVTVMANYSRVKDNGNILVNVKGNPLAKGKTTINFLKYLRELDVTNSEIMVQGKANTLIMLDDRPISFDRLKSIPVSMIASIEIEPNADPSHGVNATGGVVKVKLRNEVGLLGSASLYGEADYDRPVRFSPDLTLLFSNGKLSINNFFTSRPYERYDPDYSEYSVNNGVEDRNYYKRIGYGQSFTDNLSIRYAFNKTDYIDVYGGIGVSSGDSRTHNIGMNSIMDMTVKDCRHSYSAGLQFKKGLKGDGWSHFLLKAEYSKNKSAGDELYTKPGTEDRARREYDMDAFSVAPEIRIILNRKSNIAAGLSYHYMIDRNITNSNRPDGYISNKRFDNKGHDYEAWAAYRFYTKKLYLSAVLSYNGGRSTNNDYINEENNVKTIDNGIYPSFNLQWTINKEKMRYLNIGYNHYFSYANYNFRSPAVVWQNEKRYSVGNPWLDLQYFDQMQVYYSLNKSWSFAYMLNYGDNMVHVLLQPDENRPGVFFSRPENAGHRFKHTLRVAYSGKPFRFWYTRNTLNAEHLLESMPGREVRHASVSFNTHNDFNIYKGIGVTADFSVTGKRRTLSYETNTTYFVDLGAYASLLKDKLTVNFQWGNIFANKYKQISYGEGWRTETKSLFSMSRLHLTVTYNFSIGGKIKKVDLPQVAPDQRITPTL